MIVDIKVAALETVKKMDELNTYGSKKGLDKAHIQWMLDGIALGYITGDKAHRWLGWAQCAVCAFEDVKLEELKQINFKA